jgi:FkbM family methyltransferase
MLNIYKIKNIIFNKIGMYRHLKINIYCNYIWYGNFYGGFFICPDLLNHNSIIYSFGIGTDISFDLAVIEKHGCKVFAFDPTPNSEIWISNQSINSNFIFKNYGIFSYSGFFDFFLPVNENHISGSLFKQHHLSESNKVKLEMKTFKDIIYELDHIHIDVLKMDIEGSEYAVLDYILEMNFSIGQILVEFHENFFIDGKSKTIDIINKMNKNGFEIFAISNTFKEVSFINKNLL